MRNRIFGGIGAVWGGAILLNRLAPDPSAGQAAHQGGQAGAAVSGVVRPGAGLVMLRPGLR
jgi:hypothetical protein